MPDDPKADKIKDENWRVVYGISLAFQLYGLAIFGFIIKYPSLNELIKNNQKEPAISVIKQLYVTDVEKGGEAAEVIYDNIQKTLSEPS